MFIIENKISEVLATFLKENKIFGQNEILISVEKPGEGNMNQVLRIITNQRSLILKQSRSYVNKFPEIKAPIDRIMVEAEFYKTISSNKILSIKMPKLIGFYPAHYLLVMEDLGQNSDYCSIYKPNSNISESEIIELTHFLNALHSTEIQEYPSNLELKKLNHYHIFDFPFQLENGFDLDQIQPGLQQLSLKYKNDNDLKSRVKAIGEIYLKTGETLIHGDYYPGSWLKTNKGIKIIDPEFGYLGRPEFDLGVFIAHLAIAGKTQFISTINTHYKKSAVFNNQLMCAFAGIEIMRRILGVAQLPNSLGIDAKTELLNNANNLIFTNKVTNQIALNTLIKI